MADTAASFDDIRFRNSEVSGTYAAARAMGCGAMPASGRLLQACGVVVEASKACDPPHGPRTREGSQGIPWERYEYLLTICVSSELSRRLT